MDAESPPALHAPYMEISPGLGLLAARLHGTRFRGEGTLPGAGTPTEVSTSSRALGLTSAQFAAVAGSVHFVSRYFAVGGYFDAGSAIGGTSGSSSLVKGGTMGTWAFAGDVAARIQQGSLSVRLGPLLGGRTYSVDLSGFQKTTCTIHGSQRPCDPIATSPVQLFAQPRVRIDYSFGPRGFFFVAATAGIEIPNSSLAFGLFVGGHGWPTR